MNEQTTSDIDLYQFPRVIPADLVVIDTFPLQPIPERLEAVTSDLLGQLALSQAPFSERRIACILGGEDEGYGGHLIEHSPTDVEDPFAMALRKVPKDAHIYGIMVTGEGSMKEKHVLPSGKAYDAIAPLLLPGAPLVVVPPHQEDMCRFIPQSWYQTAYQPKEPSVFQGQTILESQVEALRYTTLSAEDCEFVAHLRLAGLRDGVHYYLTGSSNGYSGPSCASRPGMYSDLDIIAISQRDKTETEAAFENLAEAWYGPLQKVPKMVRVAGSARTLEGCIYANDSGISIDFFVSEKLKDAFVRPEYLDRNYFHQLS